MAYCQEAGTAEAETADTFEMDLILPSGTPIENFGIHTGGTVSQEIERICGLHNLTNLSSKLVMVVVTSEDRTIVMNDNAMMRSYMKHFASGRIELQLKSEAEDTSDSNAKPELFNCILKTI